MTALHNHFTNIATFIVTACILVPLEIEAQSIFKKKLTTDSYTSSPTSILEEAPVIPTIVPLEFPEIAQETGAVVDEVNAALNRKRDESANVSSPGIAAQLTDSGDVGPLAIVMNSPEEAVRKEAEQDALKSGKHRIKASLLTRKDARVFTYSRPAPRGLILDRDGRPLAQNKMSHYAGISFPQWGDAVDDEKVMKYAADRIVHVNKTLGTKWDLNPEVIRKHYANRRWMPLLFSAPLTQNETAKLRGSMVEGLELLPVYLRHYPNQESLSHVIGHIGQRPPRATGPIAHNEPIWGAGKGVQGLEKAYDGYLTGKPGVFSEFYDESGSKKSIDKISDSKPGYNVVTTIDLEAQNIIERLLKENTRRSAMVVMDCNNGDLLAMASYPSYNPNDFIPAISVEKFRQLNENPDKPLFGRAFQASYPPASTFKIVSSLAFLESGYITSSDVLPCPEKWSVGSLVMRNWNPKPEGDMNVVSAIARSCNTWFYQVGIHVGADAMSHMATQLGLGEKTGLPIGGENSGFIPNNRYWVKNYQARLSDGDDANICIGQGRVKATPIQIARLMAAVGNQHHVVQPRLVKQVQDSNDHVVEAFPEVVRNHLSLSRKTLLPVRKGMYNVVNSSYGTGKSGRHRVSVAAKTGTGQWITATKRNVAWFAGYFPAQNPIYSFAMVYEGDPGENVSGGKTAAPIVKSFLDEYLNEENLNEILSASAKLRGEDEYTLESNEEIEVEAVIKKSPAVEAPTRIFKKPASSNSGAETPSTINRNPAPEATPKSKGLFRRIFGRKK